MKVLVAIILSLMVSACDWNVKEAYAYTMNVASVVKSIKYVDENIDDTLKYIYDSPFYTPQEQERLSVLVADVDDILRGIEKITNFDDKVEAAITASEIDTLILNTRRVYTEIYGIVSVHYTEYPPEVQNALKLTSDNLIAIDKAWIALSTTDEGKDVTPIIKGSLQAIGAGIQLSKIAMK